MTSDSRGDLELINLEGCESEGGALHSFDTVPISFHHTTFLWLGLLPPLPLPDLLGGQLGQTPSPGHNLKMYCNKIYKNEIKGIFPNLSNISYIVKNETPLLDMLATSWY